MRVHNILISIIPVHGSQSLTNVYFYYRSQEVVCRVCCIISYVSYHFPMHVSLRMCVCVCTPCMYLYVCVFVCVLHACIFTYVCLCVYSMHVSLRMCVCVCVLDACIFTYVCLCLYSMHEFCFRVVALPALNY